MLPPASDSATPASAVPALNSLPEVPTLASVLDSNDPAVQAFLIQAALTHQQATEAAAAAAAANQNSTTTSEPTAGVSTPVSTATTAISTIATTGAVSATAAVAAVVAQLANTVPPEVLQRLLPSTITSSPLSSLGAHTAVSAATSTSATASLSALTSVAPIPNAEPIPVIATSPASTTLSSSTLSTISTVTPTPVPAATTSTVSKPKALATTSSSSSTSSLSSSTKRFNPDDIFCLGCCRNLPIDNYTCPNTNRVFKSCNACRQKSRINSKKVTKPATVPTKPTISMEEFGARLRELEDTQEESHLDVMVRLEGSVEMDPETLKTRGSQIAAQVYESTGYWFSHSRTNDETQSKTRLKIYGCSQREDRRAPPAPKTQSRKRNRPSTKSYFPCKGNLTMTFYHNMNHVRVVYGHRKHAKYDNRKCPDHVRAYVKGNLNMPPRQLYDALKEKNPGLGITQAQVRYWSHYYKKNMDQDEISDGTKAEDSGTITTVDQLAQSAASVSSNTSNDSSDGLIDTKNHISSLEGSPSQQLHVHTDEERVQLLIASNAAALQSLAAQTHQVEASLLGDTIAISVPMSEPLTPSIVQRVLDQSGKDLLQLEESLQTVSNVQSSTDQGSNDAVVQQVQAFMKENDHQQELLEQQQRQQQQQQELQLCPKQEELPLKQES
ncbi:hypothetical protein BC939DRAFT_471158 [Gamsiella multidivaricata]|uniref:uncharacterized protein n=1 Tax=Gamsiella multidivaricata TaxID=101098 RepID=UPI00221E4E3C|nr:uncharacterized protein BC939DRAFT_471158 [Gamsiella multidivaricata]KAG0365224.1 hypothetical protein BGZ54_006748 [Gamsiella multidivaricata]KAI7815868.1 hypothetical protein BC939DRAFT_471158 [Gamsiella multidivaricata]